MTIGRVLTKGDRHSIVLEKCGLFLRWTWWGGARWVDDIRHASALEGMYSWDQEKLPLRFPCSKLVKVGYHEVVR